MTVFAMKQSGATAFPPPVGGRDREGGCCWIPNATTTPLPNPPPQGGREHTANAAPLSPNTL